jgi:hypothetical protein
MRSTKKWIEVLSFDDKGRPCFGGPFFSIPSDDIKTSGSRQARFAIEYKKDGKARMNYDKDLDMIVYDHLISETNEQGKPYTMVPDGDYQGFKWANGKWVLVDKVFDFKLEDGQAPMPAPLKDADGKSDELKLMQQSEKNRQSQKQPLPTQPKAPVKKTKILNRQKTTTHIKRDTLYISLAKKAIGILRNQIAFFALYLTAEAVSNR